MLPWEKKKKGNQTTELTGNTSNPTTQERGKKYFNETSNLPGVKDGDYYFSIYNRSPTHNILKLNYFNKHPVGDTTRYVRAVKPISYKNGMFTYTVPELKKPDGTIIRKAAEISGNTIEVFVQNYNETYNEILLKNKIGNLEFPTNDELQKKLTRPSRGVQGKRRKVRKVLKNLLGKVGKVGKVGKENLLEENLKVKVKKQEKIKIDLII